MIGAQPFLGFVVGRASSPASGSATRCSRLWAFRAHAIIGFALPLLAFIHGWQSMSLPGSRSARISGLWIATLALFLLALQAMIGLSLGRPNEQQQGGIRRLHRALAMFLIVLASAHVFLNG
jgi:hypothetical protein